MQKTLMASVAAVVAVGFAMRGGVGEPPAAGGNKAASVKMQAVDYKDGDVACQGFLAYDPTRSARQPVVLVIGDWFGLTDFAKHAAEQMGAWGYAGFAVDMYGGAKVTTDPAEAGKLASQFRGENRAVGRKRARAALDALKAFPFLDLNKTAAMGFCFGGSMSLELAYSGAPLKGAISIHGHPTAPDEADSFIADLLVLHGADDPHVPAKMLTDFQDAVRKKKGSFEIDIYSDAVHACAVRGVDAFKLDRAKYNAKAAKRAFERTERFLADAFAR
jgi:dienelactone hydrolase